MVLHQEEGEELRMGTWQSNGSTPADLRDFAVNRDQVGVTYQNLTSPQAVLGNLPKMRTQFCFAQKTAILFEAVGL